MAGHAGRNKGLRSVFGAEVRAQYLLPRLGLRPIGGIYLSRQVRHPVRQRFDCQMVDLLDGCDPLCGNRARPPSAPASAPAMLAIESLSRP